MRTIGSTLVLAIGLLLFLQSPISGQVYSGSITGVVTDPTNAVVPNAAITLTDENKGFTFKTVSAADGRYVIRNLPPGTYRLSAESPGMRPHNQSGIVMNVGENAEADIHFDVQGTTETVQVEAVSPLLQTQDASTGQVVNQRFINDLPLIGRSVFNLAQLSPGVTQAAGGTFGLNANTVNFI